MVQSFKPCYKWNTFNTMTLTDKLNQVVIRFKPCYKWNTFNTRDELVSGLESLVLNLVISGIPSILIIK